MQIEKAKAMGRKGYVLLCAFFVLFILLGYYTVSPKQYIIYTSDEKEIVTPTKVDYFEDSTVYYLDVTKASKNSDYLMFYTNHQTVKAYGDGVICYALRAQDTIWGHSTGSCCNMLKIPNDIKELRIEIAQVYQGSKSVSMHFYAGDPNLMTREIVADSFAGIVVSLCITVCGIIMMIYWLLNRENRAETYSIFYFSIFCMCIGIWASGETYAAILLFSNRPMASYLGYMIIYFVCIPFTLFTRYFLNSKRDIYCKLYFALWAAGLIFTNALQIFNIRDMKQTSMILHAIIALGMVYCIYLLIQSFREKENQRQSWICLIGMLCMIVTYGVDVIWFYEKNIHANQIGKFGILTFIGILGVENMRHSEENLRKARMTNFYMELATRDILADCYNRTAYHEDLDQYNLLPLEEKIKYIIYVFDLNNLKLSNDTLGHHIGDRYIKDSAALLKRAFGKDGKIYRIGGDEFCVISREYSLKKAKELCEIISNYKLEYEKGQTVLCSIASGCAKYMPEDKNFETVRNRADSLMYEKKKKMKEQN